MSDTRLLGIIARAENGEATIADGYYILNRLQDEYDYLQHLIDNIEPFNMAVTMTVRGQDYVFESVDSMTDWVSQELG